MSRIKHKYNYFYKITNNLNNHFYYGIHSTDNLDDGYMGSGVRLHYAYKKYGIENFTKEILKFFDTREKANEYEAEIVTEELIKNENCYNIITGGGFYTSGMTPVKDKDGNTFLVNINDPRYLSRELISVATGKVNVKDKDGNIFSVNKDDPRILSGELLATIKGKIWTKDKNGKFYIIDKNDKRYLNGELYKCGFWTDKHHKKESINKMKETHKKNHHQQGEKNSQFGTCWIHNDKQNLKIKKEELLEYLNNGWIKGRKMKF